MPKRQRRAGKIEIHPVTPARLEDVTDLFKSHATTRGCWCMYFIVSGKDRWTGWGDGNKARFEALTKESSLGLVAYEDGLPVGWCATGPRSRYQAAIGPRARILKGRDPAEDDSVWFVPCFFVRVGRRGAGITHRLLEAAVESARANGAHAIEGFPVTDEQRVDNYLGSEKLFSSCGFTCIARPSHRRVVMRRELS